MPTYEWRRLFGREFAAMDGHQQQAFLRAVSELVDDLGEGRTPRSRLRVKGGARPRRGVRDDLGVERPGDVQLRRGETSGASPHRLAAHRKPRHLPAAMTTVLQDQGGCSVLGGPGPLASAPPSGAS